MITGVAVNDYLLSVIFGIIEGLTEFLPVSSTAHLRIAEALSGISLKDPYWMMYSIVIQLGAILSVVVYFRKRLLDFVRSFPRGHNNDRNLFNHPATLIMLAFVVTALPLLYLKKKHVIDENLSSLWVIGTSLMVGGVIMWAVDKLCIRPSTLDVNQMNPFQSAWIGLIQILAAVFPGTSRSMATIAAGQSFKLSREAALEFSFYLCIPTMFAATGKELFDAIKGDGAANSGLHLSTNQWGILLVGFVVSFIVALAVIAWFMHWVRKHGFTPFAIYRLILGLGVLLWAKYG